MMKWNKEIFICFLSVLIVVGMMTPSLGSFAASDDDTVTSTKDYYDKLAHQVYDREAYRYYKVDNPALADNYVHIDMNAFAHHYNKDNPLISGCYLIYYLDTIYTEYSPSGLKVRIKFPYNKGRMDEHFEQLERLSNRLKGKSDYDTVLKVHDYLIEHFEYDYNTKMANHTDIDGFKDGVMVCSGYSLAAYYLLNKVGVETRVVTGFGGDGEPTNNHMWNIVKVDGQWYNLDITWDDRGGKNKTYEYFLKCDDDFPRHIRMDGFDVGDTKIVMAERSYKHPFSFNNPEQIPKLLFALFIIGIVVFVEIKKIRKKKEEKLLSQIKVIEDDYDDFAG